MYNDLNQELSSNFIEYAVAVNSDRAIPNSTDGLKPVAKRIIYGAYSCGFKSDKPHVKCANVVGNVMANWHPHGDSSIYGALVRLSQDWVMRYPLIDFHGSNGNISGDGPAAYRYTESRLSKLVEDGMLQSIKKNSVDFIDNYSETLKEPTELPSVFPNLLCNPNSGIGISIASNWGCHNLREVAQAIYDYIDGKEPMIYPDFPTGGVVINKNDVPKIMETGHGSVKIRGKYHIEDNQIIFTEIPYGTTTEALMNQISGVCDKEEISGIINIRNESNKNGLRLVIECNKKAPINTIINKLFSKTDLQANFSYNQIALVNKTPTELNLKDCIKIYINHNSNCIKREAQFDIYKSKEKLHIICGLIQALESIDAIIDLIKNSNNAETAKEMLMAGWDFSEKQALAILDMKLARLSKLEKEDLLRQKKELEQLLKKLQNIYDNPITELIKRLQELVNKYGDDRRTELVQISEIPKEEKKIEEIEPEKCVVVMTKSGLIKRVPITSFKTQKRNTKGVKTQDDITSSTIRTNTVDSLMVFSNKGKMYRISVNDIPVGNNTTKGTPVKNLVKMEYDEQPQVIYSLYKDTEAKYVLFVTKRGLIKKTSLEEFSNTRKKNGINAIKFQKGDELASVNLIENEDIVLITHKGQVIRFDTVKNLSPASKVAMGVAGIKLTPDDYVITALPVRNQDDQIAFITETGLGKRIALSAFSLQNRGGKGVIGSKKELADASLVEEGDSLLIVGNKNSICISAKDFPLMASRTALGNQIIKTERVESITKI